jgi:hypothetical protein
MESLMVTSKEYFLGWSVVHIFAFGILPLWYIISFYHAAGHIPKPRLLNYFTVWASGHIPPYIIFIHNTNKGLASKAKTLTESVGKPRRMNTKVLSSRILSMARKCLDCLNRVTANLLVYTLHVVCLVERFLVSKAVLV